MGIKSDADQPLSLILRLYQHLPRKPLHFHKGSGKDGSRARERSLQWPWRLTVGGSGCSLTGPSPLRAVLHRFTVPADGKVIAGSRDEAPPTAACVGWRMRSRVLPGPDQYSGKPAVNS